MVHLLNKERIKKLKKTGDTRYIYRNELDKTCFHHDAAYTDDKDLLNRSRADKILRDNAYAIANNPQYDGYQRGLASMVYKFFDKKTVGSGFSENIKQANEIDKPIIRKFNKRKLSFKDNIWGADLADMQLLSKFNKGIKYLLCVMDLFSKYAFVVPLKDKKGISIVMHFRVFQLNLKENQIKYGLKKVLNFKTLLLENGCKIMALYEGKSVVAERFIRTLKSKIYKCMTSISKNVYINKLNAIVNKYNNTDHTTVKMKPIDVKDNTYINTSKKINY